MNTATTAISSRRAPSPTVQRTMVIGFRFLGGVLPGVIARPLGMSHATDGIRRDSELREDVRSFVTKPQLPSRGQGCE